MEFDFEWQEPGWKRVLEQLPKGSEIPSHRFFAVLGSVDESEAQEAAEYLEGRGIGLDVSSIPVPKSGEAAERLHLEASLSHQGRLPGGLEPDDPLRMYWVELENLPRASAAQVKQGGDLNRLMEGLMYLILQEAPAFAGQGVLMLDLLQEGAMGLMRAMEVRSEDPVETARWYIRQAMARAVALQYLAAGESERLVASMRAYQQADRRLLQQLGRNPSPEELALELGKTVQEVETIAKMVRDAAATPKHREEPQEEEPEQETVEDSAYFRLRTTIEELLGRLDPLDRQILTLRFGLEGHKPQTTEETARSLGLLPAEVTAREVQAMALMRQ